jgi:hypothetical protein
MRHPEALATDYTGSQGNTGIHDKENIRMPSQRQNTLNMRLQDDDSGQQAEHSRAAVP